MRPTLAVVPALATQFLIPICLVAFLVAGAAAFRAKNASPLMFALGVGVLSHFWSRGAITLHSYGLFLVLGFFLSVYLACVEAKRRGVDPNILLDMAMPLLLVSILCCRVLYFLIYPSQWQGIGAFFQIWNGGLSFHGAFIGAVSVIAYFCWSRKISFFRLADIIVPGALAGYAIGRIGCLLNGCCYGHVCELPWAVQFSMEGNRALLTPPSHPAQAYSTLLSLFLFAILWKMRLNPRWNRFPGQLTLIFFAFYGFERFVVEIFRNGATAPLAFGLQWLTTAQLVSVLAWPVIGALYFVLARRPVLAPKTSNPDHVSVG